MDNPTHKGNSGVNSLGGGVGPIVAGPTARGETSSSATDVSQQFHTFLADIEELVKDVTSLNGDELAQALCNASPAAVRACKRLVLDVAEREINASLIAATVEGIADIRASEEGREGVQSFLQKRKPAWL